MRAEGKGGLLGRRQRWTARVPRAVLGHRVRTRLASKAWPGPWTALGKGLSPHLQARQALCRKGHSGVSRGVAGQREPDRMVEDSAAGWGPGAKRWFSVQRRDVAWMWGPEAERWWRGTRRPTRCSAPACFTRPVSQNAGRKSETLVLLKRKCEATGLRCASDRGQAGACRDRGAKAPAPQWWQTGSGPPSVPRHRVSGAQLPALTSLSAPS